ACHVAEVPIAEGCFCGNNPQITPGLWAPADRHSSTPQQQLLIVIVQEMIDRKKQRNPISGLHGGLTGPSAFNDVQKPASLGPCLVLAPEDAKGRCRPSRKLQEPVDVRMPSIEGFSVVAPKEMDLGEHVVVPICVKGIEFPGLLSQQLGFRCIAK